MAQLALDLETGRLLVENGGFADVDGLDEIRQHVWLRLQIFLAECVYDTTIGMPWITELSQPGTTPERMGAIYRETILGTPGITAITKGPIPSLGADRALVLSFTASTDEGELEFSSPITLLPTQTVE